MAWKTSTPACSRCAELIIGIWHLQLLSSSPGHRSDQRIGVVVRSAGLGLDRGHRRDDLRGRVKPTPHQLVEARVDRCGGLLDVAQALSDGLLGERVALCTRSRPSTPPCLICRIKFPPVVLPIRDEVAI